jgi:hypothetical protein
VLNPVTDRPRLVKALSEVLSLPTSPTYGSDVSIDMNTVGFDLGSVPIDEVLGFREENMEDYRKDSRSVRRFAFEISQLPAQEQRIAFEERQAELESIARDLRRRSRDAGRKPVSFALSLAGAAWTLKPGDPFGAILAGGSALLGLGSDAPVQVGSYFYLFNATERFA